MGTDLALLVALRDRRRGLTGVSSPSLLAKALIARARRREDSLPPRETGILHRWNLLLPSLLTQMGNSACSNLHPGLGGKQFMM